MAEIIFGHGNVVQLGTASMEAHADRLIVVQDEFRSGYECTTCRGLNVRVIGGGEAKQSVSAVACDACKGTGRSKVVQEAKCSQCKGQGWTACPECGGRGGLIVFDQDSERRPTTGLIVSIGPQVTAFKRGESVIYTSFSGHAYDLTAPDVNGNDVAVTLVILREQEVLAKVSGHLELRRVKRSAAVSTAA